MSGAEEAQQELFARYAQWYDAFNVGKDYDAEVRYLLLRVEERFGLPRRWLDIGCGTGHHLEQIQARGIEVEGLDRSAMMIERARRLHPTIRFHVGSAQDFTLEGDRDVISMLFHVMSYQHSDPMVRDAMECIGRHLTAEGMFLFDFWHTDAVIVDPPTQRTREAMVDGRSLFRLSEPVEDRTRRLIEVRYRFHWDAPQGPLVHEERHVMRHFTIDELAMFLRQAGMKLVRSEAWMADRPLGAEDWYGFICAARA